MEEYIKFILLAVAVLVWIQKAMKKVQPAAKTEHHTPTAPPMPEVAPNTTPTPGTWGKTIFDELFQPTAVEPVPTKPVTSSKSKNNKKKEISVESSLANSAAQDERNLRDSSDHDNLAQLADKEMQDFTINSAEEARRAIIWGEVLQRKY